MKLCNAQGTSFVDALSNTAFLSSVRLDRHLAQFARGQGEFEVLPDFLHEFTHHLCMSSLVGNSLTFLWLRSTRVNDSRSLDHKAADAAKVAAFQILMQPWLEGIATYAEFDVTPGDSRVMSNLMVETLRHFIVGQLPSPSGKPPSLTQAINAMRSSLASFRFSKEIVRKKADLLLSPLSNLRGGYLAGYLCVKTFQEQCEHATALAEDTDFAYLYLIHFLMDDYGMVDVLLAEHDDPVNAIQRVADHITARIELIASPLFSKHIATDMRSFETWLNKQRPSPSASARRFSRVHRSSFSRGAFASASSKFYEANAAASRDLDLDLDLLESHLFFVLGSVVGTASFHDDGRTFVFEYGDDRTTELQSLCEMTPGDHEAEMTQLLVPVLAASAGSIAVDDSILAIERPDSFAGTVLESILGRKVSHRDGSIAGIHARQDLLVSKLKSTGRMPQIIAALASASGLAQSYYNGLGLSGVAKTPAQLEHIVHMMNDTGVWEILNKRRDLVLTLSILSIASSNRRGRLMLRDRFKGVDPLKAQLEAFDISPESALSDLFNTPTGLRDLAVQGYWTRNGHRLMIMVCDDS